MIVEARFEEHVVMLRMLRAQMELFFRHKGILVHTDKGHIGPRSRQKQSKSYTAAKFAKTL